MTARQRLIRNKLGLLKLAKHLENVCEACQGRWGRNYYLEMALVLARDTPWIPPLIAGMSHKVQIGSKENPGISVIIRPDVADTLLIPGRIPT